MIAVAALVVLLGVLIAVDHVGGRRRRAAARAAEAARMRVHLTVHYPPKDDPCL